MNNTLTADVEITNPQIDIEELKRNGKTIRENASASMIDIGDRIALFEFHTKANAITFEITGLLLSAVQDPSKQYDAIVIGNRGRYFSAGANLAELLDSARNNKWKEVEKNLRLLQDTNMALKYGPIPVVAAPFSSTLGGATEISLHSSLVVAAEDLHMGLVETGVGLIPAGGGTKELRLRALSHFSDENNHDLISALKKVFDTILTAKVSRNGEEAKQIFLSKKDVIVPGKQSPIGIAKEYALELLHTGGCNTVPDMAIPVPGRSGIGIFQNQINYMLETKAITEHDAVIALHIATILCGGDVPSGFATEQQLLDLEREAFLSLLGTAKTQERMDYLLKNNKTLHN